MALTQISTQGIKDGTITGSDLATSFATTEDFTFTGANYNVLWDKSDNALEFAANAKAVFASDLTISHTGDHGNIVNTDGNLNIKSQGRISLFPADDNDGIIIINGGAVELYHNNTKKFETTSGGASITGNLSFGDNHYAMFGAGNDLQIYHSGTDTFFKNQTGSLNFFNSGVTQFRNAADNETLLKMTSDGSVELYHDGSKMLETTSSGATVSGDLTIDGSTPELLMKVTADVQSHRIRFFNAADSQVARIFGDPSTGNLSLQTGTNGIEEAVKCISNGAVELYHNGTKMIETTSTGTSMPDGKFAKFGAGNDMSMGHNTFNYLSYTGADFLITGDSSNQIKLMPKSDEAAIVCKPNAEVELYYDGSVVLETRADGVNLFGKIVQTSTSARALQLNRNGSAGQMMLFDFQGNKCGEILVDTNSTSYVTSGSDKSLKKNFQSWNENVLNLFKNINPQEFHFNNQQDTDKKHKGFIAQDMVDSFPEAYPKDDEGKYAFNPSGMVVYLMKAIQELEAEVAALKAA